MPKRPGKTFKAATLAEPEATWVKVLAIARSGAGKTFGLVGLLEAGERVFVLDTDIGGNGLATVREELTKRNELPLLSNLAWFEFANYQDVAYCLDHPDAIVVGDKSLWAWDPTVLAWEGFSNFQHTHVTEYALSLAPLGSDKEGKSVPAGREAELWALQADWGVIRMATTFAVDHFLRLHNPNGKRVSKYVTVLQDAGKEDKFGEIKRGPALQGAARDQMAPAFDLILNMDVALGPDKKPRYTYRCDVGDRGTLSKRRGFDVPASAEADMKSLWLRITGKEKA